MAKHYWKKWADQSTRSCTRCGALAEHLRVSWTLTRVDAWTRQPIGSDYALVVVTTAAGQIHTGRSMTRLPEIECQATEGTAELLKSQQEQAQLSERLPVTTWDGVELSYVDAERFSTPRQTGGWVDRLTGRTLSTEEAQALVAADPSHQRAQEWIQADEDYLDDLEESDVVTAAEDLLREATPSAADQEWVDDVQHRIGVLRQVGDVEGIPVLQSYLSPQTEREQLLSRRDREGYRLNYQVPSFGSFEELQDWQMAVAEELQGIDEALHALDQEA